MEIIYPSEFNKYMDKLESKYDINEAVKNELTFNKYEDFRLFNKKRGAKRQDIVFY
ncbi:hypothetical protein [Hathewaya limosa]|uniref:Uncharacterized protein n=1 Tax=Hathewaya limosa TaxID=1536 RepID=A0ABU0JS99_HATLI|nr:hypothetical protein [Hathewaya limosa]MDQ0479940.1 hypothetical protein [Hathewaya limosa]